MSARGQHGKAAARILGGQAGADQRVDELRPAPGSGPDQARRPFDPGRDVRPPTRPRSAAIRAAPIASAVAPQPRRRRRPRHRGGHAAARPARAGVVVTRLPRPPGRPESTGHHGRRVREGSGSERASGSESTGSGRRRYHRGDAHGRPLVSPEAARLLRGRPAITRDRALVEGRGGSSELVLPFRVPADQAAASSRGLRAGPHPGAAEQTACSVSS